MNHLAHFLLAEDHPEVLRGSFLGDYARGRDLSRYPPAVRFGIRLHRHLDARTDANPHFIQVRHSFAEIRPRVSGIAADLLLDHILARNWERFAAVSLPEFTRGVYAALADLTALGDSSDAVLSAERIIREDRLTRYSELPTLLTAFRRLGTRLPDLEPTPALTAELERLAVRHAETLAALMADLAHDSVAYRLLDPDAPADPPRYRARFFEKER